MLDNLTYCTSLWAHNRGIDAATGVCIDPTTPYRDGYRYIYRDWSCDVLAFIRDDPQERLCTYGVLYSI